MNRNKMLSLYREYQVAHKRDFLKTFVISFGFLSGLWAHLGFDPKSIVRVWLENILLAADPTHAKWITLVFLYGPTVLTAIGLIVIYRRAGILGFIAVGLAYAAGALLSLYSIPLMALAIVIGWLAAKRH